jgi:hypothetical protein
MADDQLAAGEGQPAEPPASGSSFGGFLVEATDPSRPRLLVFPQEVYVGNASGWQRLADPSRNFYLRVWDAVTPQLDSATRAKVPAANPNTPASVTASIPPEVGDPTLWALADRPGVSTTTTTLTLLIRTGKDVADDQIWQPVVSYGSSDIVIRTAVEPQRGAQSDVARDAKVVVHLSEPVGDRLLVDATCLTGKLIRSPLCADGGVRWRP